MDARVFVACLFFAVVVSGEQAPTGLCRDNERFLSCGGCQPTCQDPAPTCAAVCRTGCYCEEGQVRNGSGVCVNLSDCPPIKLAYKQDTTEPRPNGERCPKDQEYRFCEPCNRTCDNPNPICPAQCARGCFCKSGLLRDVNGSCVTPANCSKIIPAAQASNITNTEVTCKEHQVYMPCEEEEMTCSDLDPQTLKPCVMACYCVEGYVKAPNGECVRLEDCPKAKPKAIKESPKLVQAPMFGVLIYDSQPSHHDPTVEDCAPDEEYFSCGWCEPSCSEPTPSCPNKVCIRGCLCRPPLLRHHTGHCVEAKDCFPERCRNPNEEYVCLFGCELRCDGVCHRPRYCVLGCYCRIGLLRDTNGNCVIRERCSNSTEVEGTVNDRGANVNNDRGMDVNNDRGMDVNYGRGMDLIYGRGVDVNYDRGTDENYGRGTAVKYHRGTAVDFKKILGSDEAFILVPVL